MSAKSPRKSLRSFFSRSDGTTNTTSSSTTTAEPTTTAAAAEPDKDATKGDADNKKKFKLFKFKSKTLKRGAAAEEVSSAADSSPIPEGRVASVDSITSSHKRSSLFGTSPRSKDKELSFSEMDLRKPKRFGTFSFGLRKKKKKEEEERISKSSFFLDSASVAERSKTLDVTQMELDQTNTKRFSMSQPELDTTFEIPSPPPVAINKSDSYFSVLRQPHSLDTKNTNVAELTEYSKPKTRDSLASNSNIFDMREELVRAPIATIPELDLDYQCPEDVSAPHESSREKPVPMAHTEAASSLKSQTLPIHAALQPPVMVESVASVRTSGSLDDIDVPNLSSRGNSVSPAPVAHTDFTPTLENQTHLPIDAAPRPPDALEGVDPDRTSCSMNDSDFTEMGCSLADSIAAALSHYEEGGSPDTADSSTSNRKPSEAVIDASVPHSDSPAPEETSVSPIQRSSITTTNSAVSTDQSAQPVNEREVYKALYESLLPENFTVEVVMAMLNSSSQSPAEKSQLDTKAEPIMIKTLNEYQAETNGTTSHLPTSGDCDSAAGQTDRQMNTDVNTGNRNQISTSESSRFTSFQTSTASEPGSQHSSYQQPTVHAGSHNKDIPYSELTHFLSEVKSDSFSLIRDTAPPVSTSQRTDSQVTSSIRRGILVRDSVTEERSSDNNRPSPWPVRMSAAEALQIKMETAASPALSESCDGSQTPTYLSVGSDDGTEIYYSAEEDNIEEGEEEQTYTMNEGEDIPAVFGVTEAVWMYKSLENVPEREAEESTGMVAEMLKNKGKDEDCGGRIEVQQPSGGRHSEIKVQETGTSQILLYDNAQFDASFAQVKEEAEEMCTTDERGNVLTGDGMKTAAGVFEKLEVTPEREMFAHDSAKSEEDEVIIATFTHVKEQAGEEEEKDTVQKKLYTTDKRAKSFAPESLRKAVWIREELEETPERDHKKIEVEEPRGMITEMQTEIKERDYYFDSQIDVQQKSGGQSSEVEGHQTGTPETCVYDTTNQKDGVTASFALMRKGDEAEEMEMYLEDERDKVAAGHGLKKAIWVCEKLDVPAEEVNTMIKVEEQRGMMAQQHSGGQSSDLQVQQSGTSQILVYGDSRSEVDGLIPASFAHVQEEVEEEEMDTVDERKEVYAQDGVRKVNSVREEFDQIAESENSKLDEVEPARMTCEKQRESVEKEEDFISWTGIQKQSGGQSSEVTVQESGLSQSLAYSDTENVKDAVMTSPFAQVREEAAVRAVGGLLKQTGGQSSEAKVPETATSQILVSDEVKSEKNKVPSALLAQRKEEGAPEVMYTVERKEVCAEDGVKEAFGVHEKLEDTAERENKTADVDEPTRMTVEMLAERDGKEEEVSSQIRMQQESGEPRSQGDMKQTGTSEILEYNDSKSVQDGVITAPCARMREESEIDNMERENKKIAPSETTVKILRECEEHEEDAGSWAGMQKQTGQTSELKVQQTGTSQILVSADVNIEKNTVPTALMPRMKEEAAHEVMHTVVERREVCAEDGVTEAVGVYKKLEETAEGENKKVNVEEPVQISRESKEKPEIFGSWIEVQQQSRGQDSDVKVQETGTSQSLVYDNAKREKDGEIAASFIQVKDEVKEVEEKMHTMDEREKACAADVVMKAVGVCEEHEQIAENTKTDVQEPPRLIVDRLRGDFDSQIKMQQQTGGQSSDVKAPETGTSHAIENEDVKSEKNKMSTAWLPEIKEEGEEAEEEEKTYMADEKENICAVDRVTETAGVHKDLEETAEREKRKIDVQEREQKEARFGSWFGMQQQAGGLRSRFNVQKAGASPFHVYNYTKSTGYRGNAAPYAQVRGLAAAQEATSRATERKNISAKYRMQKQPGGQSSEIKMPKTGTSPIEKKKVSSSFLPQLKEEAAHVVERKEVSAEDGVKEVVGVCEKVEETGERENKVIDVVEPTGMPVKILTEAQQQSRDQSSGKKVPETGTSDILAKGEIDEKEKSKIEEERRAELLAAPVGPVEAMLECSLAPPSREQHGQGEGSEAKWTEKQEPGDPANRERHLLGQGIECLPHKERVGSERVVASGNRGEEDVITPTFSEAEEPVSLSAHGTSEASKGGTESAVSGGGGGAAQAELLSDVTERTENNTTRAGTVQQQVTHTQRGELSLRREQQPEARAHLKQGSRSLSEAFSAQHCPREAEQESDVTMSSGYNSMSTRLFLKSSSPVKEEDSRPRFHKLSLVSESEAADVDTVNTAGADDKVDAVDTVSTNTAKSETSLEDPNSGYRWKNRFDGVYQYKAHNTEKSPCSETQNYGMSDTSSSSSSSFSSSYSSALPEATIYKYHSNASPSSPSSTSPSFPSQTSVERLSLSRRLSDRTEVYLSQEAEPAAERTDEWRSSTEEREEPASAPAAEREQHSEGGLERIKSCWESYQDPGVSSSVSSSSTLQSSGDTTDAPKEEVDDSLRFTGVFQATLVDLVPEPAAPPSTPPTSPDVDTPDMDSLVDTLKNMGPSLRPRVTAPRTQPQNLMSSLPPIVEDASSPVTTDGPSPVTSPTKKAEGLNGPYALPADLGLKRSTQRDTRSPLELMKQGLQDQPGSRILNSPLRSATANSIVLRKSSSLDDPQSPLPNGNGALPHSGTGSRLDNSVIFGSHRPAPADQTRPQLFHAASLPETGISNNRISMGAKFADSGVGADAKSSRFERFSILLNSTNSASGSIGGTEDHNARMSRPPPLGIGSPPSNNSPTRLLSPTGELHRPFTLTDSPLSMLSQTQGIGMGMGLGMTAVGMGAPLLQRSFSAEGPVGVQQPSLFNNMHGGPQVQNQEQEAKENLASKYRAFPDAYLTKEKEHGKLNPRPGKIYIFDRPGMCGQRIEVRSDVTDATSWELQETISIRVVRGGWVLYEKPNFKGEKFALDEGDIELACPFNPPEQEEQQQQQQNGQNVENGKKEGEQQNGDSSEEQTEKAPVRRFIIGSVRRAVRDYSVPEISLFPEENAEGKKVIFRDTSEDARIFGFPIKANSIIINAGLWLVYAHPFFQGIPRVLEVGGYSNPAAWGVEQPYVASLHPLKVGEPRVENTSEPKIMIYDKPYFTGKSRTINTDMRDFMTRMDRQQTAFMYNVGSLKVLGGIWVGYEKEGFRGRQYLLEEGEYQDWRVWGGCDAELRSVRVIRAELTDPMMVMFEQPEEQEDLQDENTFEVSEAIPDVELFGYKTSTRSIHVVSGAWIAYSHVDFSGNQYILEKGFYNNCADWGSQDNRICSVQPILLAPSNHTGIKKEILLYPEPNFQGNCHIFDRNQEELPNKLRTKSCRVTGGSWVVYDDKRYTGSLYVLAEGDYPNLISMGVPSDFIVSSVKAVPVTLSVPSISLFGLECLEGREITTETEILSMAEEGFNHHILSIRVNSGCWVLCEYSNYRGRQFLLEPIEITNWPKFSTLQTVGSMFPVRQKRRFFRIKNKERGHFMSIQGGVEELKSGRVVVTKEVEPMSDIWYYQDGLIKSKLAPTMSLQVMGNVEPAAKVVLWTETRQPVQTWTAAMRGHITSLTFAGMVLDVKGGKTYDKDHVVIGPENEERPSQKWEIHLL